MIKYVCSLCGEEYEDAYSLKDHILTAHEDEVRDFILYKEDIVDYVLTFHRSTLEEWAEENYINDFVNAYIEEYEDDIYEEYSEEIEEEEEEAEEEE